MLVFVAQSQKLLEKVRMMKTNFGKCLNGISYAFNFYIRNNFSSALEIRKEWRANC